MDKSVFCFAVGNGSSGYVLMPAPNLVKNKEELCKNSIGIEERLEWDVTADPDILKTYSYDLSMAIDRVVNKARSKTTSRSNLFIERIIDGWKISCTVTSDV